MCWKFDVGGVAVRFLSLLLLFLLLYVFFFLFLLLFSSFIFNLRFEEFSDITFSFHFFLIYENMNDFYFFNQIVLIIFIFILFIIFKIKYIRMCTS